MDNKKIKLSRNYNEYYKTESANKEITHVVEKIITAVDNILEEYEMSGTISIDALYEYINNDSYASRAKDRFLRG